MPYSDENDKYLLDDAEKISGKDGATRVAGKKQSFLKVLREIGQFITGVSDDECSEKQALSMPALYEQLDAQLHEQNRDATDDEYAFLIDVYMDIGSSLFAICVMSGHLYKVPVYFDGASSSVLVSPRENWIEVIKTFVPAPMKQQVVFNVNSKNTRWFLMAATSVVNKRGEINSRAFFDKMIEYINDGTHPYPKLDFFHQRKMVIGKADFVARDGNVLIASGMFDDSKLAQAVVKAYTKDTGYYGASIEFYPTDSEQLEIDNGVELKVWKDGWLSRIAVCSIKDACSYMTSMKATEVNNTMDERLKKEIKKLADGDEKLEEEFVGMVDQTNKLIEDEGLITQTSDDTTPVEPAPAETTPVEPLPIESLPVESPPAPAPAPEPVFELTAEAVQQIATVVAESMAISIDEKMAVVTKFVQEESARILQEQNTALASLRAVVTKLAQDDDAKHAEWIKDLSAQQKQSVKVIYRPRQAAPVTEDDTIKDLASVAEATLANIH